jgi:hypothetical protein
MSAPPLRAAAAAFVIAAASMPGSRAEVPPPPTDAEVARIVSAIKDERLLDDVKRLAGFGTRNLFSDTVSETRGTGAARRFLADALRAASPRMQVTLDSYKLAPQGERILRPVELVNIVGVLPGRTARRLLVAGHYDSVAKGTDGEFHWDQGDLPAPGANDDGSGTAAVLELARALGGESLDATVVFVLFDGEEEGLVGSTLYAARAAKDKEPIEAVLSNDIIGNEVGGSGRVANRVLHLYSADPHDSPARELARYAEWVGEAFVPGFDVRPIFRYDRFGRGGDHTPFEANGIAAVRFTVSEEDYTRQHDVRDSVEGISPRYLGDATRVNAATLASLALAPARPIVADEKGRPLLDRGPSGYDALLRWKLDDVPDDLAGFEILFRDTTAPRWERSWWVPAEAREHLLTGISIDGVTLGVRAVDRAGHRSLAGVYVYPRRVLQEYRLQP